MRINLGSVDVTDNQRKAIALYVDGYHRGWNEQIPLSKVRKATRQEVIDFFQSAYELYMVGRWEDLEEVTGEEVREW